MRSLRFLVAVLAGGLALAYVASVIGAKGITVAPFSFAARGLGDFEPSHGPPALGRWERNDDGDWQLVLAKNVPTSEVASAGAQINGVAGLSTTGLTIGFSIEDGNCGAGAPRFNLRLEGVPGIVFLGCFHADVDGDERSFTAGTTYGGVLFPTGAVIESLSIVHDEQGFSVLDDIFVGDDVVGGPNENGAQ
jgi:hypothetical protein